MRAHRRAMPPRPDPNARMRILVTGGAGFIGSHLVRRCVAEGHEVHVLLRPTSAATRLADVLPAIGMHRLLLSDSEAVQSCMGKVQPTHIFHLANSTAGRHDTAVVGAMASVTHLVDLLTLVEAAASADEPPRLLLRTGSIAEYGSGPVPFREEQREQPVTSYAAGIVAGSHYARVVAPRLPFPIVTARLALVYGPGQAADFLIPALMAACLEERPLVIERPLDCRDLIHVSDAVEALLRLAATAFRGGEIVNVGSGEAVAVGTLAAHVAALTGSDPALIRRMPQIDPVTHQLAVERMMALTGWAPEVALEDGFAKLIEEARRTGVAVAA